MQRSELVLAAFLGLWLTSGCTRAEDGGPQAGAAQEDATSLPEPLPNLAQQQADPHLALLDTVLAHHFAEAGEDPPTLCVSMSDGRSGEALPVAEEVMLMERHPRLAPMVRCVEQAGAWQDEESGEPAGVITLHSFACASATACTGWAALQTGATGSPSYRYTMQWEEGTQWRFTRNPRLIADQ